MQFPDSLLVTVQHHLIGHPFIFHTKHNLAVRIQTKKLTAWILEDRAYLVRQIVRLDRAGINSVNENRPGHFPFVKVGNKCIYQPGHTSLSTSRFASKDNTLPFFNLQIKILQILPFSTGILKRYMVNINHHHILPYI